MHISPIAQSLFSFKLQHQALHVVQSSGTTGSEKGKFTVETRIED